MIHGFVEFGISTPNYYDIMFRPRTPKYLDDRGPTSSPWPAMKNTTP
jgi:hypothetical protein